MDEVNTSRDARTGESRKRSTLDILPSTPSKTRANDNGAMLRQLGILPTSDRPPFDVIGDVHGCVEELREALALLGYDSVGDGYAHPEGRRVVFVGDLVDRGPGVVDVLKIALSMLDSGSALAVVGNHDHRFRRWLEGRHVRVAFGLARTIGEFEALPPEERASLERRALAALSATPGYLILDGGRLIVTHGAIRDEMIGVWNETIASFCMFGDVAGSTKTGRPIRRDWAATRDLMAAGGANAPLIAYGHNVVHTLRFVNRTIDLDTGCVYGGQLSVLRYPELDLLQVPARRNYATH